jgi:hypothetical protein
MSSITNPKKLLENYQDYCKNVEKNRIHIVYFKVLLKHNKKNTDTKGENDNSYSNSNLRVITSDDYEKVLDIMQTYDFYKFFEHNLIIVESYNIEFLVNPSGEYFIKLELLFPQLGSLLEYKNSTCICPGCDETILSYTDFLCNNHLNSDIINNFDLINNYFYIRSRELEEIYNSYKNQSNINNYLMEKESQNNESIFALNQLNLKEITCYLKLTTEIDDLIEIDLTSMINNLDCMIMNEYCCFDDIDIDENIDYFINYEGDDIIHNDSLKIDKKEENKNEEDKNEEDKNEDEDESSTDIDTSDDEYNLDVEIGMRELDNMLTNIQAFKKEYSIP